MLYLELLSFCMHVLNFKVQDSQNFERLILRDFGFENIYSSTLLEIFTKG